MALSEAVRSGIPGSRNVAPLLPQHCFPARAPLPEKLAPVVPGSIIPAETDWRRRSPGAHDRIGVARWTRDCPAQRLCAVQEESDCVTIGIALRPMEATLWVGGRQVHDGRINAGSIQVTGPLVEARAEFRSAGDALHLFVPLELLDGIDQADCGLEWRRGLLGLERPVLDTVVERLAWSLLKVRELEHGASMLFRDAVAMAIVARLLSLGRTLTLAPPSRRDGLVKWRLKRVVDMVETRLEETLTLADLAACAGLSRMHFAAQFRAATGVRPHEYLVRRRVERARELLGTTEMPLAEVALAVGFQTQAHFTTVFRRFFDETPGRWRQLHRVASSSRSSDASGAHRIT